MTVVEAQRTSGTKRVADVVRMQLVAWVGLLVWPLGLLAFVFVVNLAIFVLAEGPDPAQQQGTGALLTLYAVVGASHLQAITQVFPFALGISVTRRAFYAGTAVVAVAQSALFGIVLTVLSLVERATDGWGLRLQFFRFGFTEQSNLFAQWLVYTVPFVAISAIFVFVGVVFKRWGQSGLYTVSVGFGVLVAAAAAVLTWLHLWPTVGSFFVNTPTFLLVAGYPLVIALVLGAAGFALIRRATP